MELKARNETYTPKYEYDGWTLSISKVNKHTFTIENKENQEYFSDFSSDSFLDAEEKVFERFFMGRNCDHIWDRQYPHTKTGECVKCGVCKPNHFESPYTCDHENCNEKADFAVSLETYVDSNFCFSHYMDKIGEKAKEWQEDGMDKVESFDKDYYQSVVFNYLVLSYLIAHNDFEKEDLLNKIELVDKLSVHYSRTQRKFFAEEGRNIGVDVRNKEYWQFLYEISVEDVSYFAYKYLIDRDKAKIKDFENYYQLESNLKDKVSKIINEI